MPPDEEQPAEQPDSSQESEEIPAIEDAYTEDQPAGEAPPEDDPALLDPTVRSLDGESEEGVETDATDAHAAATLDKDDSGDADAITEEPESDDAATESPSPRWQDHERPARRTAVELKKVEEEVRKLLEGCDPRRKRKLGGSRRWRDLEDELVQWRYGGRVSNETLDQLHRLIARRHHLFHRLRHFAFTRTRWNS